MYGGREGGREGGEGRKGGGKGGRAGRGWEERREGTNRGRREGGKEGLGNDVYVPPCFPPTFDLFRYELRGSGPSIKDLFRRGHEW